MSLRDLNSAEAVRSAMREFTRLGRTEFLRKYGFGRARTYMLRDPDTGDLFDSKAIVGAAYGFQFPDRGPLRAEDYSGGEETVERKLTELGFEVITIGEDWSEEEVRLTVADYLAMLDLESRGEAFDKSEHNRQLRKHLRARSKAAIELKHQNISAVMRELGLPAIRGYKPRGNYQRLLVDVITEFITQHQAEVAKVVDNFEDVKAPGDQDFTAVLVDPPQPVEAGAPTGSRPRIPRKLDFAQRDENNRKLGRAGESWTLGFESHRLRAERLEEMVPKIVWASDRLGDGLGYDIESFDPGPASRYIEVKTTNGGALTPFNVSRNEVEFSRETDGQFYLYRVFDFSSDPRLFILRGSLQDSVALEPVDYRARLKVLTR
jgi:hypothetical protein